MNNGVYSYDRMKGFAHEFDNQIVDRTGRCQLPFPETDNGHFA